MTTPTARTVSRPNMAPLNPPKRLLLGPGPGNAHPSVHTAMALPQIGHLDPAFIGITEDLKTLLRYVWQTKNQFTIPCSGTGSSAWEACVANLTNPGDKHLVFVNGYFGERHLDMASRFGAKCVRVDKEWGGVFSLAEITAAIDEHKPQIVWMCHAETSTGALQDIRGVAPVCRRNDALLILDTVTSIGGVPLLLDEWGVDACYAGGQKCLSCPPGASPLTFGPRAVAKMNANAAAGRKAATWYLDMQMIAKYLVAEAGAPRVYHHTAPISMVFALRQALQLIADEGLENVWARHAETGKFLWQELEAMGLEMLVPLEHRLPTLTTVKIPPGVDGGKVVTYLRENFNMEIGGGLGALKGKVWRIGMMGYNSNKENVLTFVTALKHALRAQGKYPVSKL